MAYRFRRKEAVAKGFRRIIREQTGAIVSLLADRGSDLGNRVHEARRRIKRARALLRLVRDEIAEAAFDAQNRALRNAARRLARSRDAEASLATFKALARDIRTPESAAAQQLLVELLQQSTRAATSVTKLASIAAEIRKSGHQIAELPLRADDWLLVGTGLQRSFRSARKMAREMNASVPNNVLHEWRKRVKRLSHQLELFRKMLSKPQRKITDALDRLGKELGEHHDLHVLQTTLTECAAHGVAAAQCPEVNAAIEEAMKLRLRKAQKFARAAFRGRTKAFMDGMHRAWREFRRDAR